MKIRSVRGTHDIYGNEINKHNLIKKVVNEFANLRNFQELKTPIFEFSDLFSKPLGDQSDVVLKEMYSFEDRNGDFLTLRPEYTTPMIRAAISNNLLVDLPLKIYGIGPMFRRERPQKGRFRQFNQINFEILGSEDYLADVELISTANDILKKILPEQNIKLNINTLGSKKDLLNFKKKLSNYFNEKKSNLSKESREKINSNPLRILDSKDKNDSIVSKEAPIIYDMLSKEHKLHYEKLKDSLKILGIDFVENNQLVRGLDYYCSTVFEFKTEELGSQDTILGGGRYDGLVGLLGGSDIPGIGWAAGVERIAMLINKNYQTKSNKIHLAILDRELSPHLLKIIEYLKENNLQYYWNYKYNLKKSLSKANNDKSKYIIIIGDNEYKGNFYTIKNLSDSSQVELKLDQINEYLND